MTAADNHERLRIRRAQRLPIANLRSMLAGTKCLRAALCEPGKARGRHSWYCPYGQLQTIVRALDAATRGTRR